MLSNEGDMNRKLLKELALKKWKNNLVIQKEIEIEIPVDAFEIYMLIYGQFKILLEYEIGTFALKIWSGEKYEYLDKFTNDRIVYGFESIVSENITWNYRVLDDVLEDLKAKSI